MPHVVITVLTVIIMLVLLWIFLELFNIIVPLLTLKLNQTSQRINQLDQRLEPLVQFFQTHEYSSAWNERTISATVLIEKGPDFYEKPREFLFGASQSGLYISFAYWPPIQIPWTEIRYDLSAVIDKEGLSYVRFDLADVLWLLIPLAAAQELLRMAGLPTDPVMANKVASSVSPN